MTEGRKAAHPINPIFVSRWSPRALDPRPIDEADLARLFEAARWAPSCSNSQPWRFIYAHRDTKDWPRFLELLKPRNQLWAHNAAALLILCAAKFLPNPGSAERAPSPSYGLDAGAAWMSLALQAFEMGLVAHAMAGFDRDRAASELGVPEDFNVEAAIAIGWPGDKAALPEALQARETPSDRNPISSFAFAGRFGG